MYDSSKDALDALQAAPSLFQWLLHGCTEEQARAARGGDEGWSVIEVLCHLRDAEERALERMRSMRNSVDPFLAAYDQDLWAQERNYGTANLHEALAAFVRFREQHIAELKALSPAEWERRGQHEEQGTITILSSAIHLVTHDAIHSAQIARQLGQVTS